MKNVGEQDKRIRYLIAVLLVFTAILLNTAFAIAWAWVLLIPATIIAFSAAVGFCGLYKLLGINTCKINKS